MKKLIIRVKKIKFRVRGLHLFGFVFTTRKELETTPIEFVWKIYKDEQQTIS